MHLYLLSVGLHDFLKGVTVRETVLCPGQSRAGTASCRYTLYSRLYRGCTWSHRSISWSDSSVYTLRERGEAPLLSPGDKETLLAVIGEGVAMWPQNLDKETQSYETVHTLGYLLVAAVRSDEENVATKLNIVYFTFT